MDYQPPAGVQGDAFPATPLLADFANATCAQEFQNYVGISYLNSSLYFTYLLPSARGWQESATGRHLFRHHHRRGTDRQRKGTDGDGRGW